MRVQTAGLRLTTGASPTSSQIRRSAGRCRGPKTSPSQVCWTDPDRYTAPQRLQAAGAPCASAADDGGGFAASFGDDLVEAGCLGRGAGLEREIIDDEQLDGGQAGVFP